LRSGLVVLACALLAPGLGAEPAKRAGAPTELAFLAFVRMENQGLMNHVPSHVVFEPRKGVVAGRVTRMGQRPKAAIAEPRRLVLVGGDTASFSVRPGAYSIKALTPVKDQPPPLYEGEKGHEHVWKSPEVKVVLSAGETICLIVDAGITGTDYDGSWIIQKAATPADCGPPP
jgi:hypothetical protein